MALSVSYGCWLFPTVSQSHEVSTCLSLSPVVAGCLSLSLPVQ